MQYRHIRIRPISVFPELDSIKLFGAIFSAISELYPENIKEFKNNFEKGNIRLSSAFPVVKNTYFFPKPILLTQKNKINEENKKEIIENYINFKKFKKTKFVSKEVFEEIIKKGIYDRELIKRIDEEYKIENGCLISKKEKVLESEMIEEPKVVVNRFSQKTKIFYKEGIYYKNTDLYFFVDADERSYKIILTAVKFLEDRGFGPKYSSGFGQFKFIEDNTLELNTCGERWLILSKYMPNDEEITSVGWDNSFYQFKEIKGLTKGGSYIAPMYVFTEGSCFAGKKLQGKLEKSIPNYILNGVPYIINVM